MFLSLFETNSMFLHQTQCFIHGLKQNIFNQKRVLEYLDIQTSIRHFFLMFSSNFQCFTDVIRLKCTYRRLFFCLKTLSGRVTTNFSDFIPFTQIFKSSQFHFCHFSLRFFFSDTIFIAILLKLKPFVVKFDVFNCFFLLSALNIVFFLW